MTESSVTWAVRAHQATMPTISIVVPTYNRLGLLQDAVASVAAQTFSDWELIIVDDGSDDGTEAWGRTMTDPRISVLHLEHRGGPSAARNTGIAAATGDWIAFLDSDDGWAPDHLERSLASLALRTDAGWCVSGLVLVSEDRVPMRTIVPSWTGEDSREALLALLRCELVVATPAVVVRRNWLEALGGFDEALRFGQDLDLWYRLAMRGTPVRVDGPTVWVRKHGHHERAEREPNPEVYRGRVALHRKLLVASDDAQVRRLCRQRIGRYSASVSSCCRVRGAVGEARTAAWDSVRAWPWSLRGWRMVVRSWLSASVADVPGKGHNGLERGAR